MEGFVNFNQQNFDPNTLAQQTASVIQCVAIIDVSPSIANYVTAMNKATTEVFMQELKTCHRADDIVVMGILFNEKVTFKSGFQPISNLPDNYLHAAPSGRGTALYDAVLEGLENVAKYREDLEMQGIDVKTNIFVITDGDDNSSAVGVHTKVAKFFEELRKNEAWATTFTITVYGVGNSSVFENSCKDMGLEPSKVLTTIGADPKEIRNMMGVVSKSISSSSASVAVQF